MGGYIEQQEIDLILKELKKRVSKVDHEETGETEETDSITLPEEENLSFSEAANETKEKSPLVKKVEFAPFRSQHKVDAKDRA